MKDQDLLKNLQKEIADEFCEPLQGEQKEECVNYYEEWVTQEEEPKEESKQMKILSCIRLDLTQKALAMDDCIALAHA